MTGVFLSRDSVWSLAASPADPAKFSSVSAHDCEMYLMGPIQTSPCVRHPTLGRAWNESCQNMIDSTIF